MADEKESEESFDIDAWAATMEATGKGVAPAITISTGKEVQIKKATAAQLYLIVDLIKQVALHLKITNFNDIADAVATIENPVDFLSMVGGSIDRLLDLVAALCDLNEQTIKEGVDLDDLLLIVWAEWQVNQHFFMTRLLPLIQKLDTGGLLLEQVESDPIPEGSSATGK
jgi:hypothetical protein